MDLQCCRGELFVRGPEFCRAFGPGSVVDFHAPSKIVPGRTWGEVLADDVELFEPIVTRNDLCLFENDLVVSRQPAEPDRSTEDFEYFPEE